MSNLTTIKVTSALRDRAKRNAAEAGLTIGDFLDRAISDFEQAQFIRAAQRQRPDADYLSETAPWQAMSDSIAAPWEGAMPGEFA